MPLNDILPAFVVTQVLPWVIFSLLPSVIAGLSLSPTTSGWAARVKTFLHYLSLVTYKDQPGTFKLPLTKGPAKKPKKKVTPKEEAAAVPELLGDPEATKAATKKKKPPTYIGDGI